MNKREKGNYIGIRDRRQKEGEKRDGDTGIILAFGIRGEDEKRAYDLAENQTKKGRSLKEGPVIVR